jgi:hypothetical protein
MVHGRKGIRESKEGFELTKVKHIHSWNTLRNTFGQ